MRAIFREIISASREPRAARCAIAYLGPEATFTHLAAGSSSAPRADYAPATTIAEVFHDVESGRADLGVVPVENSTEGMVAHTLDLLVESPLAHLRRDLAAGAALPAGAAGHAARATCGGSSRTRRRWRSAGSGWRRTCRASRPRPRQQRARRRARAAAERGIGGDRRRGGGRDATGSHVLARGIQDEPGQPDALPRPRASTTPRSRAATTRRRSCFSVRDEVGILARMLRPFATHGIDLIKIESRPLRERPWEYVFFLDLKGHRARAARAAGARRGRARARCA